MFETADLLVVQLRVAVALNVQDDGPHLQISPEVSTGESLSETLLTTLADVRLADSLSAALFEQLLEVTRVQEGDKVLWQDLIAKLETHKVRRDHGIHLNIPIRGLPNQRCGIRPIEDDVASIQSELAEFLRRKDSIC